MKLTDICSNEKFIKGELYGSNGFNLFIKNGYWGNPIEWYKGNGKKAYLDRGELCAANFSGFILSDFNDNNWDLYEFIDGKMVEYVEKPNLLEIPNSSNILRGLEAVEIKLPAPCEWKPAWQIAKEQEGIMQPIEAIRWMRENPDKVVEAVEDKTCKYKWTNGKVLYLFNNEYICNSWTSTEIITELKFFAYTYRIAGE